MRLKVLRNHKKSLQRRKDSNSLVLKTSTRNSWNAFHFMLLFFSVGLGWEGPEISGILEEEKCKFNSCLNSLELLVSRLASFYQDWERKNNHGIIFSDSLKLFRKLPFQKKKKGPQKGKFQILSWSKLQSSAPVFSSCPQVPVKDTEGIRISLWG